MTNTTDGGPECPYCNGTGVITYAELERLRECERDKEIVDYLDRFDNKIDCGKGDFRIKAWSGRLRATVMELIRIKQAEQSANNDVNGLDCEKTAQEGSK